MDAIKYIEQDDLPIFEHLDYPCLPPGFYWHKNSDHPPSPVVVNDDGMSVSEIGTDESTPLMRVYLYGGKLAPLPIPPELI